jgi:protein-disulfide isomerase
VVEAQVVDYFRKTAGLPRATHVHVTQLGPSALPGWQHGTLVVTLGETTESTEFWLSDDGRYLLRGELADLHQDPVQANLAKLQLEGQPVRGNPDAPVTVVEFSDFQCQFCAQASKMVDSGLLRAYRGKVRLVHKNRPLTRIHPWAQRAAIAGECAYAQSNDLFWRVYDEFFRQQAKITPETVPETARRVVKAGGGDPRAFTRCLEAPAAAGAVRADVTEALSLGVQSTPTYFINGRRLSGVQPLTILRAIIDEELGRE